MSKKEKTDKSSPFYALKEIRDKMQKAEDEKKTGPAQKTSAASSKTGATRPGKKPTATLESHEDDVESFHRMMTGTEPFSEKKRGRAGADDAKNLRANEIAGRARSEAEIARERLSALAFDGVRFEVTDDGAHLEGRRPDTPPETLRKLRRGLYPVDAKLDLHEMIAVEAEAAVFAFLQKSHANKERVVLLIHGQGRHSPEKTGVLRGEVGAWLSQGRARRYVSAFATARADDGGEGATYVALVR